MPANRKPIVAALPAAALLCCLAACTGDPAGAGSLPGVSTPADPFPSAASGGALHIAQAPLGGRGSAEFDLAGGATSVRVHTESLGAALYRATTAADSAVRPAGDVTGNTVTLTLGGTGRSGPSVVDIALNSSVAWEIRLDGGASEETVDAHAGGLRELDFGAGASRIEATLPAPSGTVAVNLTGGASSVSLHLPDAVPAQLTFGGGGGSATIDGATHTGLSGGTVLSALDYAGATNRYAVNCTAGISQLTLDRS